MLESKVGAVLAASEHTYIKHVPTAMIVLFGGMNRLLLSGAILTVMVITHTGASDISVYF